MPNMKKLIETVNSVMNEAVNTEFENAEDNDLLEYDSEEGNFEFSLKKKHVRELAMTRKPEGLNMKVIMDEKYIRRQLDKLSTETLKNQVMDILPKDKIDSMSRRDYEEYFLWDTGWSLYSEDHSGPQK